MELESNNIKYKDRIEKLTKRHEEEIQTMERKFQESMERMAVVSKKS
jgi:hypothetical protein